jgi:rare lipoprotein A
MNERVILSEAKNPHRTCAGDPSPSARLRMTMLVVLLIAGCTTAPPRPAAQPPEATTPAHGVAGWYGQEFAGRTTANGEIFDPLLMTAAHRTLPFGTLVDVKNPKTGQTVRVRVNDRGPYIGNRLIDLS